jgi:hypothetical protein
MILAATEQNDRPRHIGAAAATPLALLTCAVPRLSNVIDA